MATTETRSRWAPGTWQWGYWGPGWEITKTAYRKSRITRSRCLWCWTRKTDLNHVSYVFTVKRWGGRIPWPFYYFALVPLCRRCHTIETWTTRNVFRSITGRWGAHLLATYIPYAVKWWVIWHFLLFPVWGWSRPALLPGLSYLVGILR